MSQSVKCHSKNLKLIYHYKATCNKHNLLLQLSTNKGEYSHTTMESSSEQRDEISEPKRATLQGNGAHVLHFLTMGHLGIKAHEDQPERRIRNWKLHLIDQEIYKETRNFETMHLLVLHLLSTFAHGTSKFACHPFVDCGTSRV